jgi:hypothetical protein
VSGLSFGSTDFSATTMFDQQSCLCLSWIAATTVSCLLHSGAGLDASIVITVGAIAGTASDMFTLDGNSNFMQPCRK